MESHHIHPKIKPEYGAAVGLWMANEAPSHTRKRAAGTGGCAACAILAKPRTGRDKLGGGAARACFRFSREGHIHQKMDRTAFSFQMDELNNFDKREYL